MSSSLISSSSSSGTQDAPHPFVPVADLICNLTVILGNGTVTVRRCLALQRNSVLRLEQSAGEDLQVKVNGVMIARGEVVIVEDSTAIRITDIPQPTGMER
jgi:flagellar motor switch protein FliN